MSDFKPGDRVRVEFEAKILRASAKYLDLEADNGEYCFQQIERCTLIEPEIVLPEIPGTIVLIEPGSEVLIDDRFSHILCYRLDTKGCWRTPLGAPLSIEDLRCKAKVYGYRVIPAAEAVTE